MMPMAGRTVLVTGGTGGTGRATALGLATMGANVAIAGRNATRAEDAAGVPAPRRAAASPPTRCIPVW